MKIISVTAEVLVRQLRQPWRIATSLITKLEAVLVRIETDEGIVGYGECCSRIGPSVAMNVIDEILAPLLVGQDPADIGAHWERMFSTLRFRGHTRGFLIEAISGVDIALWDIAGQRATQPIGRLLHGMNHKVLPAYASSILINSPDMMAEEAFRLVEQGYSAIKIKISGKVTQDVARVAAVREAAPDIMLFADANSGFTAPDAIAFSRKVERYDLYFLEEPLPLDDIPGYRRLRAATGQRVALGEGEFHSFGIRSFLEEGLIDLVQPNVTRAGGITGCLRIAATAHAFNLPIALHTGASGPVCMAATLQLASSLPGTFMHEHMYLDNPFVDFFETPLPVPEAGEIAVPQAPGLGVPIACTAYPANGVADT
ncbi:mandelate racemase/muconate lactonizing enzyme family protein [Mesorhizobium sp. SB112]|uniref:mandelate racemase/muconate lactonizing enzyme family protein n=2 Tax=Pseudomonadota TaxID=1224 RepID=UPI00326342F4